jgi:hypothetical protein
MAAVSFRQQLMARRRRSQPERNRLPPAVASSGDEPQASLLDVVDNVLNRGAVLNGDLILGVANVDLIYARLSVLLAALDKVTNDPLFKPIAAGPRKKRVRRRHR